MSDKLIDQEGADEVAKIIAEESAIRELLPGDFYRLHPAAQAAAWRVAKAQVRA